MRSLHSICAAFLGIAATSTTLPLLGSTFTPEQLDFFEKKIRPVLIEKCFDCHGSEAKSVKGGLLLDSRDGWIKGGDTGAALVPGSPEKSLAITAIHYTDDEMLMPPKKTGGKLPDSVIANFEAWIREGAAWPEEKKTTKKLAKFDLQERKNTHWCWKPPISNAPQKVQNTAWARSITDQFILASLESKNLKPAPDTDRFTLLRRTTFALTGLPPSLEEIRAFLDDSSPQAFEKVVDRLVASPHFGERWARHWMDLVRYAEGRGHEFDYTIPNAWQYRDYLVRAFNSDLPYSRFLQEHIAGDLLPARLGPDKRSNESVLATGFWFLGEEVHSPVDIRQDEADRIDNRLDVMSKSFLGLTVTCARCHDHKFDAISQKDYSALAGFLISSSNRQVRFETIESERHIATALAANRSEAQTSLAKVIPTLFEGPLKKTASYVLSSAKPTPASTQIGSNETLLVKWKAELESAKTQPSHPLHLLAKLSLDPTAGSPESFEIKALKTLDSNVQNQGDWPSTARILADYTKLNSTSWLQDGYSFGLGPAQAGDLEVGGTLQAPVLSVVTHSAAKRQPLWKTIIPDGDREPGSLKDFDRSGQTLRTPETSLAHGKLWYLVRGLGKAYACVDSHLMIAGPLHGRTLQKWKDSGDWQWIAHDLSDYKNHRCHIELIPDGTSDLEIAMVVEALEKPPIPFAINHALNSLKAALGNGPLTPESLANALQSVLQKANSALAEGTLQNNPSLIVWADWMLRNHALFLAEKTEAKDHFIAALAPWVRKHEEIASAFQPRSKVAPAMFEGSGVDEFLLRRGSTRSPMEPVPRRFLEAISGNAPIQKRPERERHPGSARLELSEAMLAPENPLTSRVIVNRVWHHLFGRGIVPTVDNFGVLGQAPSHPELLDYLALRFSRDLHWSLKSLIRELVLTRTFAMSSTHSDARAETEDPQNILLHRMNLRRLEGEAIRDSLLAASGRLDPTLGGPSIPIFINPFMEGRGRPASGPLDGAGRRSLYISIKRNFLSPMMLAFDMPIPFQCVGKRNVSNVPAQSLVLMNDPFVVEQAALLAKSLPSAASPEKRIRTLYLKSLGREPIASELADALSFVVESSSDSPEAVWADLCHVLFNTKEFIHLN